MAADPLKTLPPGFVLDSGAGPSVPSGYSLDQAAPAFNPGAALDTIKDLPRYYADAYRSGAMGLGDLAVGSGQLMAHVTPDVILRPLSNAADVVMGGPGNIQGNLADRYSGAMRNLEAGYQAGRANPNAPDVGRFTGNVIGGMAMGGGNAATLPGRMLQGAKLGTTYGLAYPVNPDAESFATTKAIQTGASGLLGAIAPPITEGIVKVVGSTVNAFQRGARGLLANFAGHSHDGGATIGNVGDRLEQEFAKQGIDWNDWPAQVKAQIVLETQRALKQGGTIDQEAIARLADFNKLEIKPTAGQIMRDPLQFAREQNYAKTEVGAPLASRFGEQNTQLIGALNKTRANVGATSPDQYAAGQNVIAGMQAQDAARKAAVSEAYTAARSTAGMEADVPLQPVADRLGKVVEDFGEDRIPGAVMGRLKQFGLMDGTQTRVFNIREAEKLKTLIGNNIDASGTPTAKALTLLRNSIDDAVNSLGETAGGETGAAFRAARGLASQRFQSIERTPALQDAIANAGSPEQFVQQHFIRGSIQDTANALRNMPVEARAEVRGAVIDWLQGKGVSGAEDTAKFSQAGLNKALDAIGPRKLELIFAGDRAALDQLRTIARVGRYVQVPPVASGVNYSSSGTTLLDALTGLQNVNRIPGIGPALSFVAGRPADMAMAYQTARALGGAPPVQPAARFLSPAVIEQAARPLGLLSSPVAAAAVPLVMQRPERRGLLR